MLLYKNYYCRLNKNTVDKSIQLDRLFSKKRRCFVQNRRVSREKNENVARRDDDEFFRENL